MRAPRARRDSRRSTLAAVRVAEKLLPATGDVDELVAAVAAHRGRPIRVLPENLPVEAPTGFWLPYPDEDYVIYPADVGAEHRTVPICHELAHMLLEHNPQEGNGLAMAALAPSVDPAVAARFLTRHGYSDSIEAEAEHLATRIVAGLARRAAEQALSPDTISTRLR